MPASMYSEDASEQATGTFVPSKDWLDAYLQQATAELIEFANKACLRTGKFPGSWGDK